MEDPDLYSDEEEKRKMEILLYQQFYYNNNSPPDPPPKQSSTDSSSSHKESPKSPSIISISSDSSSLSAQPHISPHILAQTNEKQERRRQIRSIQQGCHFCRKNHLVKSCPLTVCPLCGQSGHSLHTCKNHRDLFKVCSRCHVYGHTVKRCPELWRQYHSTNLPGPPQTTKPLNNLQQSCAICAGKHHYSKCKTSSKDLFYVFKPNITKYDRNDVYDSKCRIYAHRDSVNPFHFIHQSINLENSADSLTFSRRNESVDFTAQNKTCSEPKKVPKRSRTMPNSQKVKKSAVTSSLSSVNKSAKKSTKSRAMSKSTDLPSNNLIINSQRSKATANLTDPLDIQHKESKMSLNAKKNKKKIVNNSASEPNNYFLLKRVKDGRKKGSQCPKEFPSKNCYKSLNTVDGSHLGLNSTTLSEKSNKFGKKFKPRGFDLSFGYENGKSDL